LRQPSGNGEVERLFKVAWDGKIDSQQNWKALQGQLGQMRTARSTTSLKC